MQLSPNIRYGVDKFTFNIGSQISTLDNVNNQNDRLVPDASSLSIGPYVIVDFEDDNFGFNYGVRYDYKSLESKDQTFDINYENKFSNIFVGTINEKFSLSFDILSGLEHDLYYVIEHCDFNWEKSQLIKSEYIQGFDDVKIDNYSSSFNTYQIYTNYNISFPNSNTSFKKSGNYMVKVKNNEGKYVFEKKFVFLKQTSLGSIEISKSRKTVFRELEKFPEIKKEIIKFADKGLSF